MRKIITILAALSIMLVALPATAAHDKNPSERVRTFEYALQPVADNNGSNAGGQVRLTALPNGKIQVKVHAWGLAPNLPHAQHIHAVAGGTGFVPGTCPTIAADGALGRPVDGLIDTVEGVPDYGLVRASLTTVGDTSPASALAVDRFPVANSNGWLKYNRTFTPTDPSVWEDLSAVEVVVHGVDLNGNGGYDFEAGPSSLTPDFPLEATIPALCGGPGD